MPMQTQRAAQPELSRLNRIYLTICTWLLWAWTTVADGCSAAADWCGEAYSDSCSWLSGFFAARASKAAP